MLYYPPLDYIIVRFIFAYRIGNPNYGVVLKKKRSSKPILIRFVTLFFAFVDLVFMRLESPTPVIGKTIAFGC